jgi:hypothetical protein
MKLCHTPASELERYVQPEIWSQTWRSVPVFPQMRRARSIQQHEYVLLDTGLKFTKKFFNSDENFLLMHLFS